MSISDKLLRLNALRNNILAATEEKGLDISGTTFENIHELWVNMSGERELQEKEAIPSDVDVIVKPDDGYALSKVNIAAALGLQPYNIRKGQTLFGIEGTAEIEVTSEVPDYIPVQPEDAEEEYEKHFSESPPEDMMVLADEHGNITYGYFLDNWEITSYDPETTDFSAIGWRRLSYHTTGENAGTWTDDDFSSEASTGWNYLKHIISCTREKLYYNGVEVWPNAIQIYIAFTSEEPFTIQTYNGSKNWDGNLYYSTDYAIWNEWSGNEIIYSSLNHERQCVYMRGIGNTKISGAYEDCRLVLAGNNINCVGNVEALLDFEAVANGKHPYMAERCFALLFNGCESMITAPELPATSLSPSCYAGMFSGSGIKTPPALPAKILSGGCYQHMFERCKNLVSVPRLPATSMTGYCYYAMFAYCINLTTLPALPATRLAEGCYMDMFLGCSKIRMSKTKTDVYNNEYRIPTTGTATNVSYALSDTFKLTTGSTIWISLNQTFYTSNNIIY